MDETVDTDTGELFPQSNGGRVSAHAQAVALAERGARRAEERGDGLTALYDALKKAHDEIDPVLSKNKAGARGDYTTYDRCVELIRPVLLKHGIIYKHGAGHVFQMGEGQAKTVWLPVFTDFIHVASGQVARCELPLPVARADPQVLGAVFQYGKRYTLLGGLGLATGDKKEDDDADSAKPRDLEVDGPDDALIRELKATETEEAAEKWKAGAKRRLDALEPDQHNAVKAAYQTHVLSLRSDAPADKKGKK